MREFDPDKPIKCPVCGDDRDGHKDSWIATGGIWQFKCLVCEAEWEAIAKRRIK